MMNKAKALYIHIPFCHYICSYCDFTKLQYFSFLLKEYLHALKNEMESYQIDELDTIYVGGGTPTSLSLDELKMLLEIIKPGSKNVKEYTFEANPDSLTKDKLILLHQYGVNRLSIGVESTDDKILSLINRHHSFLDVKRCIQEAREIGFNNINVDLILGLPNMSKAMIKKDILNVISLGVEHVSCYSLTVHEHTRFYLEKIAEKDDDFIRDIYDIVKEELSNAGYEQYEISNFAKDKHYSLHNLTYWKDEQYYGVGLGASGYLDNIRYTNTKNLTLYNKGIIEKEIEEVDLESDKHYFIYLNLRTIFGLDLTRYQEKFHEDLYLKKKDEIDELISLGLLIKENNTLRPSYQALMTLDNIVLKLF